jgi:hypothetical protein
MEHCAAILVFLYMERQVERLEHSLREVYLDLVIIAVDKDSDISVYLSVQVLPVERDIKAAFVLNQDYAVAGAFIGDLKRRWWRRRYRNRFDMGGGAR